MKNIEEHITVDTEIQQGQPVFSGTRVPIEALFLHLENGISLKEFLSDFPSVKQHQAIAVLEMANKTLNSSNFLKFYETVD